MKGKQPPSRCVPHYMWFLICASNFDLFISIILTDTGSASTHVMFYMGPGVFRHLRLRKSNFLSISEEFYAAYIFYC